MQFGKYDSEIFLLIVLSQLTNVNRMRELRSRNILKEISDDINYNRISKKNSLRETYDTRQDSRKRKTKSNVSMTKFKKRRKI